MTRSKGRRYKAAISFLVVALGALAIAEGVVRRWFPVRALIFRLDGELLHETRPSTRRLLVMDPAVGGDRILIEIGPEGFRGGDSIGAKRAPRVACFGDSLVMAENVPLAETFVARLETHLAAIGTRAQCINAGVTGYGPDQAWLRLQRELARSKPVAGSRSTGDAPSLSNGGDDDSPRREARDPSEVEAAGEGGTARDERTVLAPDAIVFVLCAHNDHGDLVRNKLLRLEADGSLRRAFPRAAPELVERFAEMERVARPFALQRLWTFWRENEQRLADARARAESAPPPYIDWYLEAAAGEHAEYVARRDERVYSLFRDYYDADLAIRPDSASARDKRALMHALLAGLRDTCARRRLPLLLVVVPSAVDMHPTFDIRVDPARYPTYDARALDRALLDATAELGIPAVSLWERFEELGPERVFVGLDDFHWNALGQDEAARLVARRIADEGWLAE